MHRPKELLHSQKFLAKGFKAVLAFSKGKDKGDKTVTYSTNI